MSRPLCTENWWTNFLKPFCRSSFLSKGVNILCLLGHGLYLSGSTRLTFYRVHVLLPAEGVWVTVLCPMILVCPVKTSFDFTSVIIVMSLLIHLSVLLTFLRIELYWLLLIFMPIWNILRSCPIFVRHCHSKHDSSFLLFAFSQSPLLLRSSAYLCI